MGDRYEPRRWNGGPECWWIVFDHETQQPTGRLYQTWAAALGAAGELNRSSKPKPDRTNLDELVKQAIAAFNAMTPAEQAEHRNAQRESWVRGEMALGEWERGITKTIPPAPPPPAPRCARCDRLDAALWRIIQTDNLETAQQIAIEARSETNHQERK